MFLSSDVKQAIPLQKKERERLKERAENWKRIEALAAENPDMEAIAKQLQTMNLKPSGGGAAAVSIDDIMVDDSGGDNGNNSEDEPNDIAAKIEEETSAAAAATSKSAKAPTPSLPSSSSSPSVKPPVADKPLLRRKSELPTDVYTQVSLNDMNSAITIVNYHMILWTHVCN